MNRAPGFMFYPDRWEATTRHLSAEAYRFYHRLWNWMWLNSEDYCSVTSSLATLAIILAVPLDVAERCMSEIQNPAFPLLTTRDAETLECESLRVAREGQLHRIEAGREAASRRWGNKGPEDVDPVPPRSRKKTVPNKGEWGVHGTIRYSLKDREFTGISDADLKQWSDAYKAVEVLAEIKKAAAWVQSNGAKGRKSDYGRFLNNWLMRAQDQKSTRPDGQRRTTGRYFALVEQKKNLEALQDSIRNRLGKDPEADREYHARRIEIARVTAEIAKGPDAS